MNDQFKTAAEMYLSGFLFPQAVKQFQRSFLVAALRDNCGNQLQTARILGMHRNTLSRHLRALKIDPKECWPERRKNVMAATVRKAGEAAG